MYKRQVVGRALGQRQVGDGDAIAGAQALDVDLDGGRDVGRLDLERQGLLVLVEDEIGLGQLADDDQLDLDGDLLALADEDQVCLLYTSRCV